MNRLATTADQTQQARGTGYTLEVWFGDWAPLVEFPNWEEAIGLLSYYRDRYSWPLRLVLREGVGV